MTELLPPIGSPEFFEACARADKTIHGTNYTKYKSGKQPVTIQPLKSSTIYPARVQTRCMDLVLNGRKTCAEAAQIAYRETGIYITRSAVKNWLFRYRKEERAKK